jgi:hypothetical protein
MNTYIFMLDEFLERRRKEYLFVAPRPFYLRSSNYGGTGTGTGKKVTCGRRLADRLGVSFCLRILNWIVEFHRTINSWNFTYSQLSI